MNDRELLELAAKAAGFDGYITLYGWNEFGGGINLRRTTPFDPDVESWNPLDDDGDALRLAVKLRMMLDDIRKGYMSGHVVAVSEAHSCYEPRDPNPCAATRRAIVRAAAEIGSSL